MTITHAAVKISGDTGTADEWNDDHVITDDITAKRAATFIVAASDSEDTGRADYVCDGVDDEVQINQAITDLPAIGGMVVLLEGTYDIDAAITISKSNVALVGMGRGTLIQTDENISMIFADTKTGILVMNLRVDGPGAFLAASYGIHFNTVTHSTIKNCWVDDLGAVGIRLDGSDANLIEGNKVYDTVLAGVFLSDSDKNIVSENEAYRNGGDGIFLWNAHDNILNSNEVYENTERGFYIWNSNNNIVMSNNVKDNDFTDLATFDGIYVRTGDRNIIIGNKCMNNDRWEINIFDAASDRNLVLGNIAYGTDHVGAIQDNGTNTEVAHNVIL